MQKFDNPKNDFEKDVNEVIEYAENIKYPDVFAGYEPLFHHLYGIYINLSEEQQNNLSNHFHQIYILLGDDWEP